MLAEELEGPPRSHDGSEGPVDARRSKRVIAGMPAIPHQCCLALDQNALPSIDGYTLLTEDTSFEAGAGSEDLVV
jgi:hypothetical protein